MNPDAVCRLPMGGRPRLVVTNQTVGPAFGAWLAKLADTCGPLELWSGNAPEGLGPDFAGHPDAVRMHRAPAYDRSSVSSRLRTWARFSLAAVCRLLRYDKGVPLFVVTNPPFMPLAAWLLHRLQRRHFGLLEWDIYPQILTPSGLAGPRHPVYRLWSRWHGCALRAADVVVTLGEQMAGVLCEMAGEPRLPIAVVPNWVDTDSIRPLPREENPFVRAHALEDKLVVLYSGNLGATHAIETIVQVAEELRCASQDAEIQLLIIGDGAKRPCVEAAIEAGRVPNLRLLPRQPASLLPFTLTCAQIGIVSLGPGYERLSMPSKIYDFMAAGNAILGISDPPNDLAATIERHGCGANFRPESPGAIADWIRTLAADRGHLEQLRRAAREAAVQHYSHDRCQAQLTEVLQQRLLT